MSKSFISSNNVRVPEFDGMRGLGILAVVFVHVFVNSFQVEGHGWLVKGLYNLAWSGWSAVDMFFVLSGFLLGGILMDHRQAENYYQVFYVRRICRIAPAYFLILVSFALLVVSGQLKNIPGAESLLGSPHNPLWTYFFYVQNFSMAHMGTITPYALAVTWSLAIEEQFYLIIPFLIRKVAPKKLPYILLSLICMAPMLRAAFMLLLPKYELARYVLLPCRWDSLFLGVLGAWMVRQSSFVESLKTNVRGLEFVFGVLGAGILLLGVMTPQLPTPAMTYLGLTWVACFYLVMIFLVLYHPGFFLKNVLSHPWLVELGIRSYGIYLLHAGVNTVCFHFLRKTTPRFDHLNDVIASALGMFLSFALAFVLWRFVERPILQFGHRIPYRRGSFMKTVKGRESFAGVKK